MAIVKERIITVINRVRNDKSLRLKIAVFFVVVFLLYLHFKDIDNRNVELTYKVFDLKSGSSRFLYSVSLDKDDFKIKEFTNDELTKNYCDQFGLFFGWMITMNPMIVRCSPQRKRLQDVYTNGDWSYIIKTEHLPVGQNNKYLLRSDYSMVDKLTGDVINNPINKHSNDLIFASTISKNNKIFTFDKSKRVINEVKQDGSRVEVVKLPWSFFGFIGVGSYVNSMISSDNGDYLFVVSNIQLRGFNPSTYLLIVNVGTHSIIYKKKISNQHTHSVFMQNQTNGITFNFRTWDAKLHAYKLKFNEKKGNKYEN